MADIAFAILGVDISGGMLVVFEHAIQLTAAGHRITFVSGGKIVPSEISWHRIGTTDHADIAWRTFSEVASSRFDYAIATFWRSFFDLHRLDAGYYLYFVQSIESRFYPPDERVLRAAVEATYEVPIGIITEATWIHDYLSTIHGRQVEVVLNGIDKTLFRPDGIAAQPRVPGRPRVLVEGPVEVAFKNVPKAIELCRAAGVAEIWLLTSTYVDEFEGVDRVFSRLPIASVPAIYRSCDVIVKLSYVEGMFGPPLEMFHCGGTAIVYAVTGHNEYIKHGVNALVADIDDDDAVVTYLRDLLADTGLLTGLQQGALLTAAQWPSWNESGRCFADAIVAAARSSTVGRDELRSYGRRIWQLVEGNQREREERTNTVFVTVPAPEGIISVYEATLRSTSWRIASRLLKLAGSSHFNALSPGEQLVSRPDLDIEDQWEMVRRAIAIKDSTLWELLSPLRMIGKFARALRRGALRLVRRVSPPHPPDIEPPFRNAHLLRPRQLPRQAKSAADNADLGMRTTRLPARAVADPTPERTLP